MRLPTAPAATPPPLRSVWSSPSPSPPGDRLPPGRVGALVGYHLGLLVFALLTHHMLSRKVALVREHVGIPHILGGMGVVLLLNALRLLPGRPRDDGAGPLWRSLLHGMRTFGRHVALGVNAILLTIIYFGALGPTALVARLLRRRFLDLAPAPDKETFWQDLDLEARSLDAYFRQY
ncbi:MAG: hypothetical protein RMK29_15790 [Myxococcales bacterium]|nr:hypothetical protein [Myxococcota bacterium]MDW8283178.1 hypothetical protein [Myxococcales bacterium]